MTVLNNNKNNIGKEGQNGLGYSLPFLIYKGGSYG
jgi:hypothetical protein